MSEHKLPRQHPSVPEQPRPSKTERGALELKITELKGDAEYLAQAIAVSQGQIDRLEKDVEDLHRLKQQAQAELKAQEDLNASKRRETHRLDMEIKKGEATISGQQDRLRILAETIETAERRSKKAIESYALETDSKLKAIKQEFDSEKERLNLDLEAHRNQTHTEMKLITEEMEQNRKKQQRTLEIEYQDKKKKTEETVAKILQDGRSKNEAHIKATEATALEVHRESESAAKRLVLEANQKAADIIRAAQHEAEEVRRRSHNAEVSFLKEKNTGLAELKLMVANAKEEAQAIIAAAMNEASESQYKVEKDNESKMSEVNKKISSARKAAEMERQEIIEGARAEMLAKAKEQEATLARRVKETEELLAQERKRFEEEARTVLANARERAQAIVETANNEKVFKFEELKALESSMFQSAKQSSSAITQEADKIALKLVEEARSRTRNIEKIVETIISEASDEGAKIKTRADLYAEKIKRELPSLEDWESELTKIRGQEQDRLRALIEPTVKNYLNAIDKAINEIFMELPPKYQSHKVIQEFAEAIANIQHKKNYIKFGDMIPKLGIVQPTSEHAPVSQQHSLKRSS